MPWDVGRLTPLELDGYLAELEAIAEEGRNRGK